MVSVPAPVREASNRFSESAGFPDLKIAIGLSLGDQSSKYWLKIKMHDPP
jgi:hypothetical protein